MSEEMIEFAKSVIKNVRDLAIRSCDVQLHSDNMASPRAKRWREARENNSPEQFAEMIIADAVDDTSFYLFEAIDGGMNLSYTASNGKTVNLPQEGWGELSGWYSGEWRSTLSNERHFDDVKNL